MQSKKQNLTNIRRLDLFDLSFETNGLTKWDEMIRLRERSRAKAEKKKETLLLFFITRLVNKNEQKR